MHAVKIGLTQRVENVPHRQERRDCLDQAWTSLLVAQGWIPIPIPNLMNESPSPVDRYQLEGVILTGGNDLCITPGATNTAPERDSMERLLLNDCSTRGVPVLGVCRGMQMLVSHFGGTIVPVQGHVATTHAIRVNPGSPMPLDGWDTVNSFHNYGIMSGELGTEWVVGAEGHDGTAEAVSHTRFPFWGIMWHPERPPIQPLISRLLHALFRGRLN